MTVASTISSLQARHALLSGMKTAPAAYPVSLPASDLPMAITDLVKGRSEWETHQGDYAKDEQQYLVRVFALPITQGQGIDQGKQACLTLLQTFLNSYKDSPTINSTTAILIERGIEYNIPRDGIAYAETAYYGFNIVLSVEERDE